MPILFSKRATARFSLKGDILEEPDSAKCPAFICRAYSADDEIVIGEAMDRALKAKDKSQAKPALIDVIAMIVTGWTNMPETFPAFSTEVIPKLGGLLELNELWELASGAAMAVKVQEADRKKSASPSVPATANSAAVPTASATPSPEA